MESVNAALKNSLTLPEKALCEDIRCAPVVQNAVVSEDDYVFVDDLLDFSKAEQIENDDVKEDNMENDGVLLADVKREVFEETPVAVHENELSVPVDELAELEWLSNFVDDSTTGYSLTLPPQKSPVKLIGQRKTGVRVWQLSDSSASSSSSTFVTWRDVTHSAESLRKPAAKKQKIQQMERRCSHCLVQKTPQWRTGPLGAKTLCNACGVRFKSGQLLPEYRPAVSPTFSSEKHSNNHRKVMEMRRKKEGGGGGRFGKAVEIF